MPKLKTLSGGDVVKIFSLFGFEIEAQRGSHVKLRRLLPGGTRQTLTLPMYWNMARVADLHKEWMKQSKYRKTYEALE